MSGQEHNPTAAHASASPLRASSPLSAVPNAPGSSIRPEQPDTTDALRSWPLLEEGPTVISKGAPFSSSDGVPSGAVPLSVRNSLVGKVLDHYELLDLAGGGGMGLVYRARDVRLDREVAVKIVSEGGADNDEVIRRFRTEAQSAARLDHENIARVFHVGESDGLSYIVFEFVEGTNVRDLVVRQGPLSIPEAVSIAVQVAFALDHASRRDVVHRDIKPSNVMLTRDGRVKVVDMGLSRLAHVDQTSEATASGVTLGTFDYISPEQARDPRNADVRSDIYSLGCTLFFVLSGRPPFPDGNEVQKLLKHQAEAPPDLRALRPDVPAELAAIVRRMLAKEPGRRQQTASAVVSELSVLTERLRIEVPRGGEMIVLRPPSNWRSALAQHLPWLVPLAALVLIVLGMQFAGSGGSEEPLAHFPAGASADAATEDPSSPATSNSATNNGATNNGATNNPATNDSASDDSRNNDRATRPGVGAVAAAGSGTTKPVENQGVERYEVGPPPESLPPLELTRVTANPLASLVRQLSPQVDPAPSASTDATTIAGGGTLAGASSTGGVAEPALASAGMLHVVALPGAGPTELGPKPVLADSSLIVDPTARVDETPGVYSSLQQAISAANNGDTIELRFDGPLEGPPLKLRRELKSLTISAAKGFRPALLFKPASVDSAAFSRSMFAVESAELAMHNVEVVLDFAALYAPAVGGWTLFDVQQGDLRLSSCTLTVRNSLDQQMAYHAQVSFIRLRDTAAGAMMMMKKDAPMASELRTAHLRLEDCVARGEAVFLDLGHALAPVSLTWNNGLLATSEYLLKAGGGPMPARGGVISLQLNHLTAHVGKGMLAVDNSAANPHLLPLDVQVSDSVLHGPSEVALVEHVGVGGVGQTDGARGPQDGFSWSGSRNVYDGFGTLWRVVRNDVPDPPREYDFDGWTANWKDREVKPFRGPAGWESPLESRRPMSARGPAEYRLRLDPSRPAASDQSDVGLKFEALPRGARKKSSEPLQSPGVAPGGVSAPAAPAE